MIFFIFYSEFFLLIGANVSYKNSAAIAGDDFPQENQTQQASRKFRFETGLSIVFTVPAIASCGSKDADLSV